MEQAGLGAEKSSTTQSHGPKDSALRSLLLSARCPVSWCMDLIVIHTADL